MIEAKDLRIGNKIRMVGSKNMVNTVFDISDNTIRNQIEFKSEEHKRMYSHLITVEENGNQYKPFEIEGIPLTEEILIKAGFEPNGVYKSMRLPVNELSERCRIFIVVALNPCECWIEMIDKRTNDKYEELQSHIIKLNGLHTLQNLYFSLKGEELTINL